MKNIDLISNNKLDNTFIIGYYGGGNFGDELLLEVLQNLLKKQDYKNIKFYYTGLDHYKTFHKDYGYEKVDPANKLSFLRKIVTSDNIIIGGGGIWGLDFNLKILILSVLLFLLRFGLGKKVYLLGIGYYSSTTKLGHISAYIASKASNSIITRDDESYRNFAKTNPNTFQDLDLSFNIPRTNITGLEEEISRLEDIVLPQKKTYIVALRRFRKKYSNNYQSMIEELVKSNPNKKFVLNIFEPKEVDPEGYIYIMELKERYKNVHAVFDFSFNPLSYYYFLKKHKDQIVTIAPQFHSIITSYQAGARFFPFVYDNKVEEVLKQMHITDYKWIHKLEYADIQTFIDNDS